MPQRNQIWEGVYKSFREVPAEGPGFDGESWLSNSLSKIAVLREEAQKNSPLPPSSNYREGLLPMLAALTYHEQKRLRILDFGGGIGFTYYQTLSALPETDGVEYHIVEREAVCEAGRSFFGNADGTPVFHTELPDEEATFDIVHLGSALQYVEDWRQFLSKICTLSRKYLLLVDVYAGNIPTFASAQCYSGSKIPMWFINFQELVQVISSAAYVLTYKSVYKPTLWGTEQTLPMENLGEQYRLRYACNLLFVSKRVGTAPRPKDQ